MTKSGMGHSDARSGMMNGMRHGSCSAIPLKKQVELQVCGCRSTVKAMAAKRRKGPILSDHRRRRETDGRIAYQAWIHGVLWCFEGIA